MVAGVALVVAAVGGGHLVARQIPTDVASPLVIATHLYALVVLAGLLWLGAGIGRAVLRRIGLDAVAPLESWLLGTALGLGVIAYVVLGLGLTGLLRLPVILGAVALLAVLVRRDLAQTVHDAASAVEPILAARAALRRQPYGLGVIVPLVEILLIGLLAQALAPPTGYDGLMYHLEGPRRFLAAGRIGIVHDLQQVNMPFAVDLLYLLGLALVSDEMPNVMHLAFALMLTIAIFAFGREYLGARVGVGAAAIFLSSTMLAIFGPVPNVDYALALFDFLAMFAVARWLRDGRLGWLAASGLLVGLSLGTKYLGGITAVALGGFLLVATVRRYGLRGWQPILLALLAFGLPAMAVAAPWYIKNMLWFGSPLSPFMTAGPPDLNTAMSAHANLGRSLEDYLLLPFRVVAGRAIEYPFARPPYLLVLVPLYLILPKHRVVTGLLLLSAVYVAIWVLGAQVIRYLTSALPELCLVAAYILTQIADHPRLSGRGPRIASGLLLGGLAVGAAVSLTVLFAQEPFRQLVGVESRDAYLARQLPNHSLVMRLNDERDSVRGVLMIGDRRAFYLKPRAWVDVSMGAFETLANAPDPAAARAYLDELGVSHVMVSAPDLEWHLKFDADGRLARTWRRFLDTESGYLEVEDRYFDLTLFRVTAP
jgi:hypothetical protein